MWQKGKKKREINIKEKLQKWSKNIGLGVKIADLRDKELFRPFRGFWGFENSPQNTINIGVHGFEVSAKNRTPLVQKSFCNGCRRVFLWYTKAFSAFGKNNNRSKNGARGTNTENQSKTVGCVPRCKMWHISFGVCCMFGFGWLSVWCSCVFVCYVFLMVLLFFVLYLVQLQMCKSACFPVFWLLYGPLFFCLGLGGLVWGGAQTHLTLPLFLFYLFAFSCFYVCLLLVLLRPFSLEGLGSSDHLAWP